MSSMTPEFRNQTARAMMNHLCPWLLSRDNTAEVTERARSRRNEEQERLIARAEALYQREFEEAFDVDYFEDEVDDIDSEDEEEDEINLLSQELGSQKL